MVLSLRDSSTPDPIQVVLEKFLEKFSASMKTWTDQFVESMKQARPNNLKSDRSVLICGATQEDDCLCVIAESMESELYEHGDAITNFGEEEVNSCTRDVDQTSDEEDDDNADLIVTEEGEGLLAKFEYPSPPIHQISDQSSLPASNFLSTSMVDNDVGEKFCANQKRLTIAVKMFDKSPERHGSNIELKPKPPDGNLSREVIQKIRAKFGNEEGAPNTETTEREPNMKVL